MTDDTILNFLILAFFPYCLYNQAKDFVGAFLDRSPLRTDHYPTGIPTKPCQC